MPGDKVYILVELHPNSVADSFLDDWTQEQIEDPYSGLLKYHVVQTVNIIAAIAKFAVVLGVRDTVATLLSFAASTKTDSDRPDRDRPHV